MSCIQKVILTGQGKEYAKRMTQTPVLFRFWGLLQDSAANYAIDANTRKHTDEVADLPQQL